MKANKTKDGDKPNGDDEHSKSRQAKRAVVPKKVQGKTKKGAKEDDAGPTAEQLEAEAAAKEEEDRIRAKEEAIKNQKPKEYDDEEMAKYAEFTADFE